MDRVRASAYVNRAEPIKTACFLLPEFVSLCINMIELHDVYISRFTPK